MSYYNYHPSVTLKDPEVFDYLYKCKFSKLKNRNTKELLNEYIDTYKYWLNKNNEIQLIGINKFPYIYFTSGVCGAIEAVVSCSKYRCFSGIPNDFPYYKFAVKTGKKNWLDLKDPVNLQKKTLLFLSNPKYSNGIFETNIFQPYINQKEVDIFYDMAYIGCCLWKGKFILSDKCAFCAFSLSKAFGVENYRLGILFSKYKLPWLEALHQSCYLNIHSLFLGIYLMKKFSIDYIPNKYRQNYKEICKKNDLKETNCPWFALSRTNKKQFVSDLYTKK